MSTKQQIPTLERSNMDEFHFGKIQWQMHIPEQHHLFRANKIEDYVDKANQFFFLPALQITAHESMSEDIEGYFLHFSPSLFSNHPYALKPFPFLQFLANPIITIPENEEGPILNILKRLETIYKKLKEEDLKLVRWYLLALLTEVNRFANEDSTRGKKNAAAELTEKYKDALTQHIYQKHTVQEYAKMLFVTPNHLNKCIKNTINKTAQNLLNDMLILEAKSLLKYSELSISQIAEQLCRRTPSNFTRFFKNQTGLSPKQYLES